MENQPHACGVDDIAWPSMFSTEHAFGVDGAGIAVRPLFPVLSVGQFSQALLGHSCQAPKL
jgi:hypothetical protein